MAVMRPSWPPPRMAIRLPGWMTAGLEFSDESQSAELRCRTSASSTSSVRAARQAARRVIERSVRGGEDFRGEQGGIGGAGLSDCKRADGNAFGHLHDGEQSVDSVEVRGGDGHAENGHEGFGGEHAGEMRCAAGAGDDDAQSAIVSGLAYSKSQSGVRWALTTLASCGMASSRRISTAAERVS